MKLPRMILSVMVVTALILSGCAKEADLPSDTLETSPMMEVPTVTEASSMNEVPAVTEASSMAEVPTAAEASTVAEASTMTEASSITEVPTVTETSSVTETSAVTEAPTVTETSTIAEASAVALTIEDVAFIGDSRTLTMAFGGRYEFNLLPVSSVFATWGGELTQESAKENARSAAEADRKLAVFWYGINDVQSDPVQKNASQFRANYEAIIDLYRSANPDSDIVILSILSTSVNEKDYYVGQEENIRTYNAELADLCAAEGYTYLDITALFTGDECLAPGDYIHFSKEWYEEKFLPTVFGALEINNTTFHES